MVTHRPAVSQLGRESDAIAFTKGAAGLDVHKKTVVAWVITPEVQEGRSFSTMTKDLLALADWLAGHRATG